MPLRGPADYMRRHPRFRLSVPTRIRVVYDVRRLKTIEDGVADLSDRDAIVELVAGLVETMVRGHPHPSSRLEERYRAQVRALSAVMRRLDLSADIPSGLRVWLESCPARASPLMIRVAAEALFEPLLVAADSALSSTGGRDNMGRVDRRQDVVRHAGQVDEAGRGTERAIRDQEHGGSVDPTTPPDATDRDPLRAVFGWLTSREFRMIDYIVATLVVTVISGVLVVVVTRGESSATGSASMVGVKSSSTSGARVFLAQGALAKDGSYLYAISLSGFPPHSLVSISCRDSKRPSGFESFPMITNATGTAAIAASPCHSGVGVDHWVVASGVGSNHVRWRENAPVTAGPLQETTGVGITHTWTNYQTVGGYQGPSISANQTVVVACAVPGFEVEDGNTWWYRIVSPPWNGTYYASADAFYNNGKSSGTLLNTPFVDPRVPRC